MHAYQLRNSGGAWDKVISAAVVSGSAINTYAGDFNGDGMTDLATRTSAGNITMLYSRRGFDGPGTADSNSAQPDAISTITAGDDSKIQISYRTMSQPYAGNTAIDPSWTPSSADTVVAAPMWLVYEVHSTHGAGAPTEMRGTRYQYFNLHMSPSGRGALGFEAESARDLLTENFEFTQYETTWPKNGLVKQKDWFFANGKRAKTLTQTVGVMQTVGAMTTPVYPYVQQSTETVYDEAENAVSVTTTQYQNVDTYGNVGKIIVTSGNSSAGLTATKTTTNTYGADNISAWILGRLTRSQVVHTASNTAAITRTAGFTYDQRGLLESEEIEPDAPSTNAWLKTTYGYDAFGHKSSVVVQGVSATNTSMTPRSTGTTVDISNLLNGYIETTVSNSLGHTAKQKLSLVHGGVEEATDANGFTSVTQYDDFGRKIRQSRRQLWQAWSYEWAFSSNGPTSQKVTATDSAGGESTVFLDRLGRTVRKETIALDERTIYESTRYDEQGRVIEARRPSFDEYSGGAIYTRYDSRGRIQEIETPGPDGARLYTRYSYPTDATATITVVSDPNGYDRKEVRNALGQLQLVEDGSGASSVQYSYDAVGTLWRTVDGAGQTTTMEYDIRGRKVRMLDPAMGEWTYLYNSFGEQEWQRDAKGQVTWQRYDSLGRMTGRAEAGDAVWTTWAFDTKSNGVGQLAQISGKDGFVESYDYDDRGLVSTITKSFKTSPTSSPEPFTTSTVYDDQERPQFVTRTEGFIVENVYNARGYLVAVRSQKQDVDGSEVFDPAALQARIDDLLGQLDLYSTQAATLYQQSADANAAAAGWLEEARQIEASGIATGDAQKRQAWESAVALAANYRGLAAMYQVNADAATANARILESHARFYATLESESVIQGQHWLTLAIAKKTALQAEAAAARSNAASMQTTVNSFTATAVTAETDAAIKLAQLLGTTKVALIADLKEDAATALTTAAERDRSYEAAAAEVDHLERQLDLLQASADDAEHITWWRSNTVDAEGRIAEEALGNGVVTRRTYDPGSGHLTLIASRGGGVGSADDLQHVQYQYDGNDNVVDRWDQNKNLHVRYGYDALDRLDFAQSTWTVDSSAQAVNWTKSYQYDAVGNMLTATTNGVASTYSYDPVSIQGSGWTTTHKRLASVTDVGPQGYDVNGNVVQSGSRVFSWDAANFPLSISENGATTTFTYGPSRERLTRNDSKAGGGGSTTAYGTGGYERSNVTSSSGSNYVEHRYPIVVNGQLIATRVRTDLQGTSSFRAEYYHRDALGSVELVTDSLGRVLQRWYYDPFGSRISLIGLIEGSALTRQNNPFANNMTRGFTGHEHLDDFGLIHMNGRVYDTRTRRFMSADPFVQAPQDTQGFNRYAYVKNNPLKYTDPSGYFLKKIFKAIKKYWRPIVGTAIMLFVPGGGFVAMFLKGFAAGMIMTRGDWESSALNGLTWAMSGGRVTSLVEGGPGAVSGPAWGPYVNLFAQNLRTYGVGPSSTHPAGGEDFQTPLLYTGTQDIGVRSRATEAATGGTAAGPGGTKYANAGSSESALNASEGQCEAMCHDTVPDGPRREMSAGEEAALTALSLLIPGGGIVGGTRVIGSAARLPYAANGARLGNITANETRRIQNAANRIGKEINVVGSRARGTARPDSDWDYVIEANAKTRNSVSRSLPGAGDSVEGVRPNIDVFKGVVHDGAPFIRFFPE